MSLTAHATIPATAMSDSAHTMSGTAPGTTDRPSVLVARRVFPETLERLRQHFEVEVNTTDEVWSPAELARRATTPRRWC